MSKIRILLADDHTLFRQGIRNLISAESDMEVIGEASNGGDAVEKAEAYGAVRDAGQAGTDTKFTNPADAPLVQIPGTGVVFRICRG